MNMNTSRVMKRIGEDKFSYVDKILNHWLNGTVDAMPLEMKDALSRWTRCDVLIQQGKLNNANIAKFLHAEFGTTYRQGYIDIEHAKQFFGSTFKPQKEYWRMAFFKRVETMSHKLEAQGKYEQAVEQIMKAAKLIDLFKVDDVVIPYDEIQPPNINIVYDPTLLGLRDTKNLNAKVDKLIKEVMEQSAYIDYTIEKEVEEKSE